MCQHSIEGWKLEKFLEKFKAEWKTFLVWGGPKKEVTPWHIAFSIIIVGLILIVSFLLFEM